MSLKMAYEEGVPVAMGSDVGTPLNYHGENALADKQSLRFVMKDGMVVAAHAGEALPKELFAEKVLAI